MSASTYQRALDLFDMGEISKARELLESYVEISPLDADAQNDLGAICFMEGFAEKALGPASIALSLDPKNPSYRENYDQIIAALKSRLEKPFPSKVRLAMFYDEEGWAWWLRSHAIKKSLPSDIQADILHLHTPFDPKDYDYLLIYDHNIVQEVRPTSELFADKIILANSCPLYIKDADASLKKYGFPAAIVNNLTAFREVESDPRWYCCENGVDTSLFIPAAVRPMKFVAGWVGHSQSIGQKGLDIIQEACKLADVELLIVDAKDKPKESRANSQEWLRDNLYHKISVYLCASQYEGTPNPGLEALACGLPVITTRVGNMPELIKDGINGYIVERSAAAFLEALKKLQGKDLSSAARNSVAPSWDWSVKALNYANVIRDLEAKKIRAAA